MTRALLLLTSWFLAAATSVRAANTWYVDVNSPPGGNGSATLPFQNARAAFQVAASGDTIRIAPGVYRGMENRNLYSAEPLRILGSGSATCIFDAEFQSRVFYMNSPGASVQIRGLTIMNGKSGQPGGGMRLHWDVSLCDVHIVGCESGEIGGGFYHTNGLLRLENVVIDGCSAPRGGAGTSGGQSRWSDCVVANNHGENGPAGLSLLDAELVRCQFENNTATLAYGGALAIGRQLNMSHCEFRNNRARRAGALLLYSTTSGISRITNSLFTGNEAFALHGGACEILGAVELSQCTVVGNTAASSGGGIRCYQPDELTLSNSILWGNSAPVGPQLSVGAPSEEGVARVRFCDVEGGQATVAVAPQAELIWEAGNFDIAPRFVNPMLGDYSLQSSSPCVHRGSNVDVPPDFLDVDGDGDSSEPMPLDLSGNPRVVALSGTGLGAQFPVLPVVDIGAYETQ